MSRPLAATLCALLLPATAFAQPGRTEPAREPGVPASAGFGSRATFQPGGGGGRGAARGSDEDRRAEFQRIMQEREAERRRAAAADDVERKTVIVRVKNVPASEIARAVERAVADRTMVVVPESVSNSLLISIAPEKAEAAIKAVEALDKAPKQLTVELAIVELERGDAIHGPLKGSIGEIIESWQPNGVRSAERATLTSLENQKVHVQLGRTKNVPAGRMSIPGRTGGPQRVVQYEQHEVGTLVQCTGRAAGENVLLDLNVERTRFEAPQPNAEGEAGTPEQTVLSVQTTIRLTPGRTVLVSARGEGKGLVAVLAAVKVDDIEKEGGKAHGAANEAAQPKRRIQVFHLKYASADDATKVVQALLGEADKAEGTKIEADARTNTIYASGRTEALEAVEAVLQELDTPGEEPED